MRKTKAVSSVAARMMTKKTDLNSQCTPTNRPQFVQVTSERINPVTEIDSLEQFGQFLLNTLTPHCKKFVTHSSLQFVHAEGQFIYTR